MTVIIRPTHKLGQVETITAALMATIAANKGEGRFSDTIEAPSHLCWAGVVRGSGYSRCRETARVSRHIPETPAARSCPLRYLCPTHAAAESIVVPLPPFWANWGK